MVFPSELYYIQDFAGGKDFKRWPENQDLREATDRISRFKGHLDIKFADGEILNVFFLFNTQKKHQESMEKKICYVSGLGDITTW